MKRAFSDDSPVANSNPNNASDDTEQARSGIRLRMYYDMNPILERAAAVGVDEIDVALASFSESSAHLQSSFRNPRTRLAAYGVPDLSDIADVMEPDSPLALTKPIDPKLDAKSPTKRTGKPSSPIKITSGRLSETMVSLPPNSSPSKAEPSPTKSTSTPSTPFKDSPGLTKTTISPAVLARCIVSAEHARSSPNTQTPTLNRLFQTPTFKDSPFAAIQEAQSSPAERDSPSKFIRPVAPTPSRWNRLDPTTPRHLFTPLPTARTPSVESPLGLVASIPTHVQACATPVADGTLNMTADVDFGILSPSFDHASWLNSPASAGEVQRIKNIKKASRRKSEPLFRHCLKVQRRRKSASPQKAMAAAAAVDSFHISPIALPALPCNDETEASILNTPMARNSSIEVIISAPTEEDSAVGTKSPPNEDADTTTKEKKVLDIDVRQNPDIFGAQIALPTVDQLAQIARDRCDGLANVIVTQENGRLVVRFKLPTQYAAIFPESQGADESHFSSSPSAISSSPRVTFKGHSVSLPNTNASLLSIDDTASSPAHDAMDRTLIVEDFEAVAATPRPSHGRKTVPGYRQISSVENSPAASCNSDSTSISMPSFTVADDGTTIPNLDSMSPENVKDSPAQGDSSSSLSLLDSTPSLDTPSSQVFAGSLNLVASTPKPTLARRSPEPAAASTPSPSAVEDQAISSSPSISFTPVNQNASGSRSGTPNSPPAGDVVDSKGVSPTPQASQSAPSSSLTHDDDSPGRDYMREFIKRSRPKRSSTTETGSPVAPASKRQPLGIKSPNTESPHQKKRKLESESVETPGKKMSEPSPKKARRVGRPPTRKPADKSQSEKAVVPITNSEVGVATNEANDAETEQDDADDDSAPARRSSRLRSQTPTTTKSAIPTPIKIGRAGTVLNAAVRSEQQDLTYQTRMNTRKNKGAAEYPAQVLAKSSEELSDGAAEDMVAETTTKSKRGKSVIWKQPLEAFHEEQKPVKGKAAPKTKVTYGSSGVGKLPKVAPAAQKQRTAKAVAESLGMASNGTPAKPQRVTRSRTRSQN